MFGVKNIFTIIIIIAILLGGTTGLYLARTKQVSGPSITSSGANNENVGDVIKKIHGLTDE